MPDIDPVSLNYFLTKRTKMNFPLDCDVFEEVKDRLTSEQIKKIMLDLGKYLAKLHQVEGEGFGLVNPFSLNNDELKGSHNSWYEFWMDNFKQGFDEMAKIQKEESKTGEFRTKLQKKNRERMHELLKLKEKFLEILKDHKQLLTDIPATFINGNVYTKNITLRNGKFVGLTDFSKALLGDSVDELAYFSVMPDGQKYLQLVISGWKSEIKIENFDERLHLHRLIEAYRKIFTRYIKHKYLDDYPEPLQIAEEELSYYNVR